MSVPALLVAQRPDVRAQEAILHEASAKIGVATANMLPQLTITGQYGGTSTKFSDLFKSGSNVWSLGAGITQPIFHGGQLLHKKRAAVAAYDQAAAQYRSTVLPRCAMSPMPCTHWMPMPSSCRRRTSPPRPPPRR